MESIVFFPGIIIFASARNACPTMLPEIIQYPLATMSNILIRGAQTWTESEAKILALALGQIHKESEALPVIRVPFHKIFKSDSGDNYKSLDKACFGLKEKVVTVDSGTGKRLTKRYYNFFKWLELEAETKTIVGVFEEELAPHLLDIAEFTSVQIETILLFRTAHAARLYWLLKSYYKNVYEPTIEQLRKQLLGEKDWDKMYIPHADFHRYVVAKALLEIKKLTSWKISAKEIKVGRRVAGYHFKMEPHDEKEDVAVIDAGVAEAEKQSKPGAGFDEEVYYRSLVERPNNAYARAWKYFTKDCEINPAATKSIIDQVDKLHNLDTLLNVISEVRAALLKDKVIKHRDRYAWSIIQTHYKELPAKLT